MVKKDDGQSLGALDSSDVRLHSNLADPDDWDDANTQHVPLSHTCEESETLVGVTLVAHAVCSSRKRRDRETQKRQTKSLNLEDRVARRKVMAQPEISHAFAKQMLRSRELSTDGHFVDAIHDSHQLALLLEQSEVLFCRQCSAVNADGSLRLLKSRSNESGEARCEAWRKLERGQMPNAQVLDNARLSF